MSISGHTDKLFEHKAKSKNTAPEEPALTPKQQQKQDALDLAEIIYDIFKDSMSSANMEEKRIKEKNNA